MKSTLVYSFRTNKQLSVFKEQGVEVFVFRKLKNDFLAFQRLVSAKRPEYIVGCAEVKTRTMFEKSAVNIFGLRGRVSKNGKEVHRLHAPSKTNFLKSTQPRRSFCNWVAYKVAEMVEGQSVKSSFIHFNQGDISEVIHLILIKKLQK